MSDQLDLDRVTEKMKAPAKRWRNRWLAKGPITSGSMICGHPRHFKAGDEFLSHCLEFPTEDAARNSAGVTPRGPLQTYLGPIAVDAA